LTPLEGKTVATKTMKSYQKEVESWSQWSKESGQEVKESSQFDQSILLYLNWLFAMGWHVSRGEKLMAGIWHFFPEAGKYGTVQIPRSLRALKGWRQATPRRSRLPYPWQVWCAIALEALRDGFVRLAFGILLAVEAYLRPSELLGVRCGDFIGPAHGGVETWVLLLHPSARGERSKVGSQDDTVPLDSKRFKLLTPLMESLAKRPPQEPLVRMDYSQFLELFNKYCRRLQVPAQPYSARHSGASIDRATNERPLDVVRKRGRWKQMASVVRYDKTGRVNDAWRALTAATRSLCLEAERRLIACLVNGAELPPSLA
jgi:integrase